MPGTRFSNYPDWGAWGPFRELERLRRAMDNVAAGAPGYETAGVFPLTNVSEDQDNYYVRAELPGMAADQIDITATVDKVSISGERAISEEGEGVVYHRRERDSGTFSRMIGLPGPVDPDKVEASFGDGMLTIKLPKSEASKPKQIAVN